MSIARLAGGLLVYNAVVSLGRMPERVTIWTNLALGFGLVRVARGTRRLTWDEIGLGTQGVRRSLALGPGLGAVALGAASFAALAGGEVASQFAARRYRGQGLALKLLFHVPVATALVEEVAFRGVLFAAWSRQASVAAGAVGSSCVFALWHVPSTLTRLAPRRLSLASQWPVLGSVAATFVFGVALCILRIHTRSLWAGTLAHAGFNAGGVIGMALRD